MGPMPGRVLNWLITSMKRTPGSPVAQAWSAISLQRSLAGISDQVLPSRGFTRGRSFPAPRASKKAGIEPHRDVEVAQPARLLRGHELPDIRVPAGEHPHVRTPPPPPCFTASVALSKTSMNETGPLAMPAVLFTMSPFGRIREKEKPVPPPLLWMRAMWPMVLKMLSMESSTGRTKQAESWPILVPAFMRVGELGRKRRSSMMRRNSPAFPVSTASATLGKRLAGLSPAFRYLAFRRSLRRLGERHTGRCIHLL